MAEQNSQTGFSLGCSKLGILSCSRNSASASPVLGFARKSTSTMHSSSAVSASASSSALTHYSKRGPFTGLVICVTGLSKEARMQVQSATERMGGRYSPDLHPQCTHLVVQSFSGRKFEHAMKYGLRRGLFVVTLSWFIDCLKNNARLNELPYNVHTIIQRGLSLEEFSQSAAITNGESSCLPSTSHEDNNPLSLILQPNSHSLEKNVPRISDLLFSGNCLYIDTDVSSDLHHKVVEASRREGARCIDYWYIGCNATHVVCEGRSVHKYIGYVTHLVTPLWILKTVRERFPQRLIHFSVDLARQVAILLDSSEVKISGLNGSGSHNSLAISSKGKEKDIEERQQKVDAAKACIRKRRGPRMQPCRTIPKPLTPSSLLDTVCWCISEPTLSACVYVDKFENGKDSSLVDTSVFGRQSHAHDVSNGETLTRPMKESEKTEVVYRGVFLTILFPADRFGELGPSARTYFSDGGFTCLQILENIYCFYQEIMTHDEIEVALHTDSKHADRLRCLYASKEISELGYVPMKRVEFLGSRRNFEGLKRVSRENTGQVYELGLGA